MTRGMPKTSKKASGMKTAELLKTPEKDDCSEQLTYSETPVASESRRRSLVVLSESKRKSPASENVENSSSDSAESRFKIDQRNELALNKVRVSLFHNMEKSVETKGEVFAVDAKSFYGPSSKEKVFPLAPDASGTTRKKLVTNKPNPSSYDFPNKRVTRKRKSGEINSGVGHGIKKVKGTVDSIKNETLEADEHIVVEEQCKTSQKENIGEAGNSPNSNDYNPNKKFFKYRRPDTVEISLGSKSKQKKSTRQEKTVTCSNIFSGSKSNKKFHEPLNTRHSAPSSSIAQGTLESSPAIFKKEGFVQQCQDRQDAEKLVSEIRGAIGTHLNDSEESSNMETETGNEVDKGTDEELPHVNLAMDIENNNFSNNEMMTDPATNNSEEVCNQISGGNTVYLMKGSVSDINLEKNSSKENSSENGSLEFTVNSKDIRNVQCRECNFVCELGNETEVLTHFDYHSDLCHLQTQEWIKNHEIDIDSGNETKIVIITPFDPECYKQEAYAVLKVINKELGLCDNELIDNHEKYFFIYVKKNTIIGVLIAEYLEFASRLESDSSAPTRMFFENIPVKCGVNAIWVSENHRRQGIATTMMDFLRNHFYDNYLVTLDDIAISIPTPDGKLFAEKYMGTCDLKVF